MLWMSAAAFAWRRPVWVDWLWDWNLYSRC